jgi:hypothetical protein
MHESERNRLVQRRDQLLLAAKDMEQVDAGGDRSQTVHAIASIVRGLRASAASSR